MKESILAFEHVKGMPWEARMFLFTILPAMILSILIWNYYTSLGSLITGTRFPVHLMVTRGGRTHLLLRLSRWLFLSLVTFLVGSALLVNHPVGAVIAELSRSALLIPIVLAPAITLVVCAIFLQIIVVFPKAVIGLCIFSPVIVVAMHILDALGDISAPSFFISMILSLVVLEMRSFRPHLLASFKKVTVTVKDNILPIFGFVMGVLLATISLELMVFFTLPLSITSTPAMVARIFMSFLLASMCTKIINVFVVSYLYARLKGVEYCFRAAISAVLRVFDHICYVSYICSVLNTLDSLLRNVAREKKEHAVKEDETSKSRRFASTVGLIFLKVFIEMLAMVTTWIDRFSMLFVTYLAVHPEKSSEQAFRDFNKLQQDTKARKESAARRDQGVWKKLVRAGMFVLMIMMIFGLQQHLEAGSETSFIPQPEEISSGILGVTLCSALFTVLLIWTLFAIYNSGLTAVMYFDADNEVLVHQESYPEDTTLQAVSNEMPSTARERRHQVIAIE